jgi:CRISPR-associated protein Cas2
MLRVIAYDIACPRRLRHVAEVCQDYGVRVQKSVFECWLDDDRFEAFWLRLQQTIRAQEDQLLAYTLDATSARRRRAAGNRAIVSEQRSHYVL